MIKTSFLGPFAASLMALSINLVSAHAETKGPVTDDLGVIEVPSGAPMIIGATWVTSGPDAGLGIDSQRGAEIAFDDAANKVAGHDVQLIVEDSACSAEGGQAAATKLASLPGLVAVIGPDCSSVATTGAPILWKAGISMIGTAASAANLTAPDRKAEYRGYLRTIYNDGEQGYGDAEFFFKHLKCTTLATIHDGSPYASQLAAAAAARFRELGGEVVAEEAVSPTDVDMRPMLTSLGIKKPCVVYVPTFVAATAQILRQAQDIADLKGSKLIGGSANMAPGLMEAAGESTKGFTITSVDISKDAMGKNYPAFVDKYVKKYGENPINSFHAQSYDAAKMLIQAIEKVAKTDAGGNTFIGKKALNEALYATKGLDGISGTISCTESGQCGGFKFAAYEYTDSDPSTFQVGVNPKKIFP